MADLFEVTTCLTPQCQRLEAYGEEYNVTTLACPLCKNICVSSVWLSGFQPLRLQPEVALSDSERCPGSSRMGVTTVCSCCTVVVCEYNNHRAYLCIYHCSECGVCIQIQELGSDRR